MAIADSEFIPPQAVKDAAQKGLKWYEDGHAGDGLTSGAVSRARSIARGERQSRQQIKRMRAWFARHEVDKSSKSWAEGTYSKPSPSQVAWALWGGDAGQSWAKRVGSKLDTE